MKTYINTAKVVLFTFSIAIGLCYSCETSIGKLNKDVVDNETIHKIKTMLITPDSLRSPEDKVLYQKMETVVYEKCIIQGGEIKMTISKNEIGAMGIPVELYDMIKKDIEDINNNLDTPPCSRQEVFEAFQKSKEEYFARKKSQLLE